MNTYHVHLAPWRESDGSWIITFSNNARNMVRDAVPNPWRYRIRACSDCLGPVAAPATSAGNHDDNSKSPTTTTSAPTTTTRVDDDGAGADDDHRCPRHDIDHDDYDVDHRRRPRTTTSTIDLDDVELDHRRLTAATGPRRPVHAAPRPPSPALSPRSDRLARRRRIDRQRRSDSPVASPNVPDFQTSPGMRDILPPESGRWRRFVETFADVVEAAGYGQIIPPIMEDLGVFLRVGEATDIVTKEMYDFEDKGGRHDRLAARS